jgi:hypothetical protein
VYHIFLGKKNLAFFAGVGHFDVGISRSALRDVDIIGRIMIFSSEPERRRSPTYIPQTQIDGGLSMVQLA